MGNLYVARNRFRYDGAHELDPGELFEGLGLMNDRLMLGNPRYAILYEGKSPEDWKCDRCGSCFVDENTLRGHQRHRHAAEVEYRARIRQETAIQAAKAEEKGETVGGYPVRERKRTRHGSVPYIDIAEGPGIPGG